MRDSLNHLPERKKGELARIVSIIRDKAPKTEMIILFGNHDPAFFKIFPMGTDEEKRRFDLLKRAYVEARYNPKYIITAEELKYLARCVELLQQQTKASCEEKMTSWSEA